MLEIPQLCARGTDRPYKVIQAALISSGLVSVEKMQLSTQSGCSQTFSLGLDWWKNDIRQLIYMHISNNFPLYLMFLLPTFRY